MYPSIFNSISSSTVPRSIYLSIYLSICLPFYLSIYLSIYLDIPWSIYLHLLSSFISLSVSIIFHHHVSLSTVASSMITSHYLPASIIFYHHLSSSITCAYCINLPSVMTYHLPPIMIYHHLPSSITIHSIIFCHHICNSWLSIIYHPLSSYVCYLSISLAPVSQTIGLSTVCICQFACLLVWLTIWLLADPPIHFIVLQYSFHSIHIYSNHPSITLSFDSWISHQPIHPLFFMIFTNFWYPYVHCILSDM